jgi:hypothetical protein
MRWNGIKSDYGEMVGCSWVKHGTATQTRAHLECMQLFFRRLFTSLAEADSLGCVISAFFNISAGCIILYCIILLLYSTLHSKNVASNQEK